jgi:hypothetical protein
MSHLLPLNVYFYVGIELADKVSSFNTVCQEHPMTLIQELMNTSASTQVLTPGLIRRFTPSEIRETIQSLVATEQIELANALGEAGLSLYPHSEDILAITSLLAMMGQNWTLAIELMDELLSVQDGNTPAFTYVMYVRALRCNLDPARALEVAYDGLDKYPGQVELTAEKLALEEINNLMLVPFSRPH